MFDLVTQKRKDQKLTFQELVIAKVSSSFMVFTMILLFVFGLVNHHTILKH